MRVPFMLRRPALLVRDLMVNRERPDLETLRGEKEPEAFLWKVLPHAARTFSACIALLPAPLARAAAVAYLYCRCLDSYEDMLPTHEAREGALRGFARRFPRTPGAAPGPPPELDPALARDERDQAHIVLVNRCALVDEVFANLDKTSQGIILDLVHGMSEGMVWSSRTLASQQGVLANSEQLRRYCGYVLGLPTVFAGRLLHFHYHKRAELNPQAAEDAMLAGEMVQLANITRDIEKDLRRGVAYHPVLRSDLGRFDDSPELMERIRQVREELLVRALRLAPAYRRFVESLRFEGPSFGRASAVLMLLFTDRHYRKCAQWVGRPAWAGPDSGLAVILKSIPAIFSSRWTRRILERTERTFLEFAEG